MPEIIVGPANVRDQATRTAIGVTAWTFDPRVALNSQTISTQVVYSGGPIYLYAGDVVTNIVVCQSVAAVGADPTGIYAGLWWDVAGTPTCLAASANLAASSIWDTIGYKVCALSAAYTVTTSGVYFPAFLKNGTFGGTDLKLNGASSTSGGGVGGQVGSGPYVNPQLGSGKTAMAAADTGTYAVQNLAPWMAVS